MKTMRDRIASDVSQSLSEFEFAPAYPEAITGDVAVVSILSQPDRNHPEQGTVMVQIRPLAFPDKYPSELEADRRDMSEGVLQGSSPDSFKEYFRQDLHWLDQERVSNDDIRGLRLQLHTTDSTASTAPHISMTDDWGRALFEGVNLFSKYTLGLELGMTSPVLPTAERTLYRIPPVGKALGAASSPQRARPSQQQAGRSSHAGARWNGKSS